MKKDFKLETADLTIEVTQKPQAPKTHNSYRLTECDVNLLIKSLQRQIDWTNELSKKLEDYNENASENSIDQVRDSVGNENFDLLGLIAMLKEGEAIQCVIPKEVTELGWGFRGHNVDMPPPYCHNDSRHDANMVTEVDKPKEI